MKIILVIIALATGYAAGDFLDDFESYAPGDGPETSYNWEREPSGGQVIVTTQGEEQVVEAFFPDSTYIGYVCPGAGFWDNGSVEMDFCPNGTGSFVNVIARTQLLSGEAYVGGVTVFLGSLTYAYIASINVSGEYELLYSDLGPIITPGSWTNVRLHLEGDNPVTITLFIDDQQIAKVFDSQYCLGEGLSGFALFYEDELPAISADNFEVILSPQSLQAVTFGAIKTCFQVNQ